jgi:hypothetical protein
MEDAIAGCTVRQWQQQERGEDALGEGSGAGGGITGVGWRAGQSLVSRGKLSGGLLSSRRPLETLAGACRHPRRHLGDGCPLALTQLDAMTAPDVLQQQSKTPAIAVIAAVQDACQSSCALAPAAWPAHRLELALTYPTPESSTIKMRQCVDKCGPEL